MAVGLGTTAAADDSPVSMHELSIARSIVDVATEEARRQCCGKVTGVTLRIGRLSAVHEQALRYSFNLLVEATPLAGAGLTVIEVPVRIWCPGCEAEAELAGIQRLACPTCGHASGDIRAGRELEIESIEIDLDAPRPQSPEHA